MRRRARTTDALAALGNRTTVDEGLELFDTLPAVEPEFMLGRWRGRELATGHPMEGLLEPSGWYGKQFDGVEQVHPLLFRDADGDLYPVSPRRLTLMLVGRIPTAMTGRASRVVPRLRPLIRTPDYAARLRSISHRGVVTAAMVYDDLPIIDTFRAVDEDTVLGVMDYRVHPDPYLFVLERVHDIQPLV